MGQILEGVASLFADSRRAAEVDAVFKAHKVGASARHTRGACVCESERGVDAVFKAHRGCAWV